jgi:fructose-1-phosphate kinase PfkB-like protein
LKEVFLI